MKKILRLALALIGLTVLVSEQSLIFAKDKTKNKDTSAAAATDSSTTGDGQPSNFVQYGLPALGTVAGVGGTYLYKKYTTPKPAAPEEYMTNPKGEVFAGPRTESGAAPAPQPEGGWFSDLEEGVEEIAEHA